MPGNKSFPPPEELYYVHKKVNNGHHHLKFLNQCTLYNQHIDIKTFLHKPQNLGCFLPYSLQSQNTQIQAQEVFLEHYRYFLVVPLDQESSVHCKIKKIVFFILVYFNHKYNIKKYAEMPLFYQVPNSK